MEDIILGFSYLFSWKFLSYLESCFKCNKISYYKKIRKYGKYVTSTNPSFVRLYYSNSLEMMMIMMTQDAEMLREQCLTPASWVTLSQYLVLNFITFGWFITPINCFRSLTSSVFIWSDNIYNFSDSRHSPTTQHCFFLFSTKYSNFYITDNLYK